MMGYLYLVCSVFGSAAKGYASKRVSSLIVTPYLNARMNTLRSFLCCAIALALLFVSGDVLHLRAGVFPITVAAFSGMATAVFLMSWLDAVREGAYMMVGAFGSGSFIVPLLGGLFILGERLTTQKALAILMIMTAILLMCRYNNKIKTRLTPRSLLSLLLVLLMQGISQFLQKLFMIWSPDPIAGVYSFYTFLFAGLTLTLFTVPLKKTENTDAVLPRKVYGYILLMAVALFAATYLQTLAARTIEAALMYPLLNVLSLLANVFMSAVLFHEKIRAECLIGMGLVLGAVLLYL